MIVRTRTRGRRAVEGATPSRPWGGPPLSRDVHQESRGIYVRTGRGGTGDRGGCCTDHLPSRLSHVAITAEKPSICFFDRNNSLDTFRTIKYRTLFVRDIITRFESSGGRLATHDSFEGELTMIERRTTNVTQISGLRSVEIERRRTTPPPRRPSNPGRNRRAKVGV